MNRNKFFITLLSFAVAFGCVVALMRKQAAQTWRLPDGSEWSLAKVTYGKKHEMMYDNRWEDYLYPVLPASWRLKLGCRVATMATDPNGVVVWIWRKNVPQAQGPSAPHVIRAYYLAVVDKNGLESELEWEPSGRHLSPSGAELDLWRLRGRPAQGEITIRVYVPRWKNDRDGLRPQRVAEFKISNPKSSATPAWTPETLPATRKTNGLEVSLLKLETGLNAKEVRMNWTGLEGKAFTRGRFNIRDRGQPSEAWDVTQITAIAASGEVRSPVSHYHQRHNDEYYYSLEGALWLEPWKLKVEISRNTNFPPEELWVVKNLPVPSAGKVNEFHAKTNIYARSWSSWV